MAYVTRPRLTRYDDLRETPMLEGQTVWEPEPVDTGLLDKNGVPIFRVMDPIGFVEMKERG